MCAIAGVIGLEVSPEEERAMRKTMERRGPDGWGIYRDRECTLLHSRLAIIDPDNGKQPMHLRWGGEEYVLSYNGELYNSRELKEQLTALGHCFREASDTEVVLHAYAQWGKEAVTNLNGIFAFAVWEVQAKRLFLARDRIGVKPLYFWQQNGKTIFASEIKTILCHNAVKPELDAEGAVQLLLIGPGTVPGSGVFRNIRELEPGCYCIVESGKQKLHRYWKLLDGVHTDTLDATIEKVRYLVKDAIQRQMISDVPIGTFLSGGLDSSIISAVCAQRFASEGKQLKTFSVDYQNNDRYFRSGKFQPEADGAYIEMMREAIRSDHQSVELTAEELVSVLEDATIARDLPGMADVDFSLLAFCGEIRKSVKVALSGECADEIFGGYPWYRDPEVRDREGFPWAQTTQYRIQMLSSALKDAGNWNDYVMDHYRRTCAESDILPENNPLERRMKEMVNLNFRWFMQTLLSRKDHMSMFHGMEVRVPFCDYRIAEYLYRVPWRMKEYDGREKGLLRKAAEGLLPEQVLYRKKSPYPKTFDPAYEQIMERRLKRILDQKDSPLLELADGNQIRAFLRQDTQWPWYGQLMRRPQTMAYFVQMDYWLRKYQVEIQI